VRTPSALHVRPGFGAAVVPIGVLTLLALALRLPMLGNSLVAGFAIGAVQLLSPADQRPDYAAAAALIRATGNPRRTPEWSRSTPRSA
jgi:hypothetical protein